MERRQDELENHTEIMAAIEIVAKEQEKINNKLDPIYNAWTVATTFGGWAKWGLGFILLLTSLFLAFREIFKKA